MFPELATSLVSDLRKLRRSDLADQIAELQVVDRCRCGGPNCGAFYMQPRSWVRHSERIELHWGAVVFESGGRIVEVEYRNREVQALLCQTLP